MRAILLLAAAASTTACFKADVANCAATCASSDDCPAGLVCTGAGRCAETASTVCTGGPDAAPDAMPGLITVTVRDDRGLPATGVRVLVAAPDGTPVADTSTSTNGEAMVLAPGTVDVTVVRTPSSGARLSTVLGAQPGDSLLFGPERNEVPSVVHTITWPNGPMPQQYWIKSSCNSPGAQMNATLGATSESVDITLDPSCVDDHDVLVVCIGLDGNTYQIATDQTDADVVLDGTWESFEQETTNLSQLAVDVPITGYLVSATNVFRNGGPARGEYGFSAMLSEGGGGATANISLPPIGDAREMVTLLIHPVDEMRYQQIIERIAPSGEYNVSVQPAMLPWLTTAPVFEPTNRRVRWSQASSGPGSRAGDLIATELKYARGATTYTWRIFAPVSAATPTSMPGEVELVLPDLPGSDAFELRPTDLANRVWVRAYGFQTGFGYAQARARADAAVSGISQTNVSTDAWFADPAVTRVVDAQYGL